MSTSRSLLTTIGADGEKSALSEKIAVSAPERVIRLQLSRVQTKATPLVQIQVQLQSASLQAFTTGAVYEGLGTTTVTREGVDNKALGDEHFILNKGTRQKLLSGFCPLRGGRVPPNSAKKNSAKKQVF